MLHYNVDKIYMFFNFKIWISCVVCIKFQHCALYFLFVAAISAAFLFLCCRFNKIIQNYDSETFFYNKLKLFNSI